MVLLKLSVVLLLFLTHEACSKAEEDRDIDKQLSDVLVNDSSIPGNVEVDSASSQTNILSRAKRQYLYPLNKGRKNYHSGAARIIINGFGDGTGRAIRISRGYGYYGYAG